MTERFDAEARSEEEAATLWASTYVLMGLKYPPEFTNRLLKGVREMRESSTYQAILQEGRQEGRLEGRLEEARSSVLRLGGKRFGIPAPKTQAVLKAISSVERLEALQLRLLDTESWEELLAQ